MPSPQSGRDLVKVVDLAETPPEQALKEFGAIHPVFRVVICGGDGSASWVMGAVEQCGLQGWDGNPCAQRSALRCCECMPVSELFACSLGCLQYGLPCRYGRGI